MQENKNIRNGTIVQSDVPSLIIDKSGRIIALNSEVKKIIPGATAQSNFFEFFDEQMLLTLQRIFIDARKYETVAKDSLEFEFNGEKKNVEIMIVPLRSDNNIYFVITFSQYIEKTVEGETRKFWIATSELEKLTDDKKILDTVNKIKLTYPFTFIEKAKIQKEVNELENQFWIKDSNGKYILVNESFAESLGLKAAHIENKNQDDFLPKYLIHLYNTIDKLINETSNTIVFEGVPRSISGGISRDLQVIEFPICDLDGNVTAIIGFSRKVDKMISSNKGMNAAFIRQLPHAVVIVDDKNLIMGCSEELYHILLLNNKIDYISQDLSKLFDKHLRNIIVEYLDDPSNVEDTKFNFVFADKGNLQTEITVQKIFDSDDIYLGAQILISPKNEVQIILETKAHMYDLLVQNTPDAMFVYDLENLKFLEVNDAALKIYGYKRSDFLNMDLTDLYAPEDIQTLITSSDKTAKANLTGPWRHKKSDGNSIMVEINRISTDFDGKKAHINIVKDVTNDVKEKKKIQILQSTYENTTDPIIIADKEGFIVENNENITRILGYSKKELEGRPFISLVTDDDRAKVNKNIFHSGILKTTSVDISLKKPSGNIQKASVIATPIKNYDGEIETFLLLIKIAEDKSSAKDIKHTQADSLEKVDPPFLSNMFHEILTPINVILGFTQELGESIDHPNQEQKEAVDIIKENQKLLLQIMDNAVEYSTLNEKVVKFKPEEIKFVEVLEEFKENTKKTAESKKVELNYGKISSTLSLESDRQKFVSLISLFIKFAIQITKENSLYLSALNVNDDSVAVAIKDNKTEITQYLIKGFHDIFSDEENSIRRNYGFSRFSIRLANKLIDLLSVKREIIVKEGKQTEFALVFPRKFVVADTEKMKVETIPLQPEVKPEQQKQVQATVQTPSSVQKEKKELDLSQLSCLYLEDQVDSQILFKSQMKDLKSIEFAPSFETALPLLKTKRFDFILMDINLQGEYNGLDALRIIQKMPGYKDVPIIASTAYVQPGSRDNFKAAGFTDFISKPLLREKIIESLKILFSV